MVESSDFHSEGAGSLPVGDTFYNQTNTSSSNDK
jgi:hypothetical protein